jgi:hypothetical protein
MMAKYLVALLFITALFACKNKKNASGNETGKAHDIFDAYKQLKLPFTVTDTTMNDVADTTTISYPLFAQFVPDSIFNNPFGKDRKLTIHPIGKIEVKNKETYLATYVSSKSRSAIYLPVFNKKKFTVSMPLIASNDDATTDAASIDKKLSIVISREWKEKKEDLYSRTIYAYNNIGTFTTILTETNEERNNVEKAFVNPLDTFQKRNKYSGDYINGKKKFLSIRDGKTPSQYLFYVYFKNLNEEDPCGGELKGQFTMVSEKAGTYSQSGDPCGIDLSFSGNQVTVKENGSCGNHRGIKCFFNDTYTKKKEPRPSSKKK